MGASVAATVAVITELVAQTARLESELAERFEEHPARYARNKRLADATYQWAFAALTASPGARTFYEQRRAAGDTHHRALRALANRLVGILHGCLRHDTLYDEHIARGHRMAGAA